MGDYQHYKYRATIKIKHTISLIQKYYKDIHIYTYILTSTPDEYNKLPMSDIQTLFIYVLSLVIVCDHHYSGISWQGHSHPQFLTLSKGFSTLPKLLVHLLVIKQQLLDEDNQEKFESSNHVVEKEVKINTNADISGNEKMKVKKKRQTDWKSWH